MASTARIGDLSSQAIHVNRNTTAAAIETTTFRGASSSHPLNSSATDTSCCGSIVRARIQVTSALPSLHCPAPQAMLVANRSPGAGRTEVVKCHSGSDRCAETVCVGFLASSWERNHLRWTGVDGAAVEGLELRRRQIAERLVQA